MTVYQRIQQLGLQLPQAPKPVAAYVPWVRTGSLIFISGQLPISQGTLLAKGIVPDAVTPDDALSLARICGLNLLAILHDATDGDLNRITRVVRLGIFVASAPGFVGQPDVGNGASRLMVDVFGEEIGRHARAAVGSVALPLGAPVEVEGVFEVR